MNTKWTLFWDMHYDSFVQKYLEKKNDEMLKIATEHYLKEYRKDGTEEMNKGHVQTGTHIVKCIYNLNFESESISYKRYKELEAMKEKEYIGEEK